MLTLNEKRVLLVESFRCCHPLVDAIIFFTRFLHSTEILIPEHEVKGFFAAFGFYLCAHHSYQLLTIASDGKNRTYRF